MHLSLSLSLSIYIYIYTHPQYVASSLVVHRIIVVICLVTCVLYFHVRVIPSFQQPTFQKFTKPQSGSHSHCKQLFVFQVSC